MLYDITVDVYAFHTDEQLVRFKILNRKESLQLEPNGNWRYYLLRIYTVSCRTYGARPHNYINKKRRLSRELARVGD